MSDSRKSEDVLVDFITGKIIENVGAEEHRQKLERFLVNDRGYPKGSIAVDADLFIAVNGVPYRSMLDLVLSVDGRKFMVIKCAAGSLESRQREVLAAARICDPFLIPYAAASDGKTAVVYDTPSGQKIGEGLDAIPTHLQAKKILSEKPPIAISNNRREKEKMIFRSYDSMNVNVLRKSDE